jgi:hypothetical protein
MDRKIYGLAVCMVIGLQFVFAGTALAEDAATGEPLVKPKLFDISGVKDKVQKKELEANPPHNDLFAPAAESKSFEERAEEKRRMEETQEKGAERNERIGTFDLNHVAVE